MTTDLKKDFNELKAQITTLQKEFKEQAAKLFAAECKDLFAEFPTLKSFSWTQYTPYFCDGDTCEFGVNDYFRLDMPGGPETSEDEDDDEDYEDDAYGARRIVETGKDWRGNPVTPTERDHAIVRIDNFIKQFDDDLMKAMFGDHVRVTVHRSGKCDTDHCDHD